MLPYIATYIEYGNIYSDKPPNLKQIQDFFHQYHTAHLIQALCKLNIALWKSHADYKLHLKLIDLFFSKEDIKPIFTTLKKKLKEIPFVFHRHQILLAIKLVLLNPNYEGIRNVDMTGLGKYLLAISSHFIEIQKEPPLPLVSLNFEFARQAIAQLNYFSHYGQFNHNIGRAIEMWLKIPFTVRGKKLLEQFDVDPHGDFLEETGLTIEEFLTLGFMSLYQIHNVDVHTNNPDDFMIFSNFFSDTKIPKEKVESFYKYLRQDIKDYVINNQKSINEKLKGNDQFENNFLPLIEWPILKINDKMSIVSDPQYFEERVFQGPYWILLNRYIREGVERSKGQSLSGYFGMLHQEHIYNTLLRVCDQVVEIPVNNKEQLADFVGIINSDEGKYLLVVEAKKISLSLPMILNSERDNTIRELKDVFTNKGFSQVFNTIHKIQNEEAIDSELGKIDLNSIKVIFPILATDRFIVEESLNRRLYEIAFLDTLYNKRPFKFKPQITHPMILSVEDLEKVEAIVEKEGKIEFIRILGSRHNSLNDRFDRPEPNQFIPNMYILGIEGMIKNLDTFWNYLFTLKPDGYVNQRLKYVFETQLSKVKKTIFENS